MASPVKVRQKPFGLFSKKSCSFLICLLVMALPTIKRGELNYYGQPEFVDRIINAWKAKNARNNSYKLQGFYGTVYKVANVNVENTEYYVKQIIPSHYNATFLGNMKKIIREIEISNILTGLVPDSVSNLMGARVLSEELINEGARKEKELKEKNARFNLTKATLKQIIDPELAYSYLIFEGPEGMTLDSAFRLIGDSGKSLKERLKDYLAIICSAKAAIDSVNSVGYLHNDVNGSNIFVTGNGTNARCKLIDFGEAIPIPAATAAAAAEPLLGGGSTAEAASAEVSYQKYNSDIKNLIRTTIGNIFGSFSLSVETVQFGRYLSIQLPSDIYQYDDKVVSKMIKTDKIIDEIFNLCGRDNFVEYRIINNYVNEEGSNKPLIPLESGPHPTAKKGFFSKGGYKKKTRRKNKKRSRRAF